MPPLDLDDTHDQEKTHGRKVEGARWHQGKLQLQYSEKYERYSRGRFLAGGQRTVWEDVPGEMPAAQQQDMTDTHGISPEYFWMLRDLDSSNDYYLCFGKLDNPDFFRARLCFNQSDTPFDVALRLRAVADQIISRFGPDIRHGEELFSEDSTP
jgi:hypothetical protein